MSDPRAVLQDIQERAPYAMDEFRALADVCEDDIQRLFATLMDVPKMHAALSAVLDFTVGDKTPIWVGIALDEIIADAMGGTDA